MVRLVTKVTKYNTVYKRDTKPIYSFHVYFPNKTICISELCLNIIELSLLLPQRHHILRWDGQVHWVTFKYYNPWLNLLNRNQFIFHVSQSASLWHSSSVNVNLTAADTLLLPSFHLFHFLHSTLAPFLLRCQHRTQGLTAAKPISPFSVPYEEKG